MLIESVVAPVGARPVSTLAGLMVTSAWAGLASAESALSPSVASTQMRYLLPASMPSVASRVTVVLAPPVIILGACWMNSAASGLPESSVQKIL